MRIRSFDQDKNYLLQRAQLGMEAQLLERSWRLAILWYERLENPLDLQDDLMLILRRAEPTDPNFFSQAYHTLSDIYRLLYADNQLEIIWDGRTHYEKYSEDWSKQFDSWMHRLCQIPGFNRCIIKGTFLNTGSSRLLMVQLTRMIFSELGIKKERKGTIAKVA